MGHKTDVIEEYVDKWDRISSSVTEAERELLQLAVEKFEQWK